MLRRRIVCAANKNVHTHYVILGVRHFDMIMHKQIEKFQLGRDWIQGFVDNRGEFLDRKEAFEVAQKAGQIIRKTGGENSDELFSEDLY